MDVTFFEGEGEGLGGLAFVAVKNTHWPRVRNVRFVLLSAKSMDVGKGGDLATMPDKRFCTTASKLKNRATIKAGRVATFDVVSKIHGSGHRIHFAFTDEKEFTEPSTTAENMLLTIEAQGDRVRPVKLQFFACIRDNKLEFKPAA